MAAIKFEAGVPHQVQLKFSTGKPYGNQMMYSLADGNVMFVPLIVEKYILALQARRGQTLEICKELADGKMEWKVRRVEPAVKPQSAPSGKPSGSANGHAQPAAELLSTSEDLESPYAETFAEQNLERALRISLLAAKKAEEYGQKIGKPIQFDKGDVRAMAATLLINGRGRAA